MTKTLNVYLNNDLVSRLTRDKNGRMSFNYVESWLENTNAIPLSQSLPLRKKKYDNNSCEGFFPGVLPEESIRDLVAKNLGISKQNDFAMLELIGGECAGAVTFIPSTDPPPDYGYKYRPLSDEKLKEVLELLPSQPLLAGEDGIRLSLAGAQSKISVHISEGLISIPLGGAPSTHIIKPNNERIKGLVINEAYCQTLASAIDLDAAKVEIRQIGDIEYLLIERYDRWPDEAGNIHRLHQEDFCQALGIPSKKKYQTEGGPTLKMCFDLLRESSSVPAIELMRFLDAVIFNLLIGNNDAHGKNYSLLYRQKSIRLAPLYDLISTVYYPKLSSRMAMRIGKAKESFEVYSHHFEQLADDVGLAKPIVRKRIVQTTERVLAELPNVGIQHQVADDLKKLIEERCRMFLDRFHS